MERSGVGTHRTHRRSSLTPTYPRPCGSWTSLEVELLSVVAHSFYGSRTEATSEWPSVQRHVLHTGDTVDAASFETGWIGALRMSIPYTGPAFRVGIPPADSQPV